MVLGDYYVEEDETPDVGQDDPTSANAAAADEMPPGTPRVSRAPKQGFYFLARQEARTPTPAGNPQKRQDYMLAQVKEVEPALGGFVLQKAQALSVAHRQGRNTKLVATGLVHLVTKPREAWPLTVEAAFDRLVATSWVLKADPTLAEGVFPVPHGAPVPAVVAYVGAAMAYERCSEGD